MCFKFHLKEHTRKISCSTNMFNSIGRANVIVISCVVMLVSHTSFNIFLYVSIFGRSTDGRNALRSRSEVKREILLDCFKCLLMLWPLFLIRCLHIMALKRSFSSLCGLEAGKYHFSCPLTVTRAEMRFSITLIPPKPSIVTVWILEKQMCQTCRTKWSEERNGLQGP